MYTIKRAAELTGVPAATLRAWERRYGVVVPQRTDSGYRVYDEECLARIRAVAALVEDGWAPSQAAREIARAAESNGHAVAVPTYPPAPADASARPGADAATDRLIDAAVRLDAAEVARVLDERFGAASFESVVDGWLLPALGEVGRAWADGRITVAGEHLIAHAVFRRLGSSYDAAARSPKSPTVIIGLPSGVHHELGLFAFAVALRRAGVDVVYLGPDLPADAWRAALDVHTARCAVIAAPRAPDVAATRALVEALAASHPEITIVVGGGHQDDVGGPRITRLGHAIGPAAESLAASLR